MEAVRLRVGELINVGTWVGVARVIEGEITLLIATELWEGADDVLEAMRRCTVAPPIQPQHNSASSRGGEHISPVAEAQFGGDSASQG